MRTPKVWYGPLRAASDTVRYGVIHCTTTYLPSCAQDNPHDTAQLDPELLPLPSAVRIAAGAPHLVPADCFLHNNGEPSWQLLHLLRYAAASPAERRSAGHRMAAGEQISPQVRWGVRLNRDTREQLARARTH
jgi:hypothetical protein